jgi:hypothetical protein
LTAKANFTTKVNDCIWHPVKDYLEFNKHVEIYSVTLSNDESINLTDKKYDPEVMDSHLTSEVLLPRGDTMKHVKVICRLTD